VTKSGRAAIASTTGNEDCHIVLRGGRVPNYDRASVEAASTASVTRRLHPRIMIDSSHANSGKNPDNQPRVIHAIGEQIAAGDRRVLGVMIESHLVGGRQDLIEGQRLVYGQSITDGCIDWETSIAVLETLAQAVRMRR